MRACVRACVCVCEDWRERLIPPKQQNLLRFQQHLSIRIQSNDNQSISQRNPTFSEPHKPETNDLTFKKLRTDASSHRSRSRSLASSKPETGWSETTIGSSAISPLKNPFSSPADSVTAGAGRRRPSTMVLERETGGSRDRNEEERKLKR